MKPVRSQAEIAAYRDALSGMSVSVIGAARSGIACAELLVETGARVTLADLKPAADLPVVEGAALLGGFTEFGQLPPTDLMVTSPGLPATHPAMADARAAGAEVIGTLEFSWRMCPAPVVAVTGANGKGTCCRLISDMLTRGGVANILAGNIGLPLARELAGASPETVAVVEVSSFQLEGIVDFRPRVALMLNLAPEHLDRHADFREYVQAKARLFENQTPDDFTLVNHDDLLCRHLAEGSQARGLTVGLGAHGANARVEGGRVVVQLDGRAVDVCAADAFPLPGQHHVSSVLHAALVARLLDVAASDIAAAVSAYEPPEHHMQVAAEIGGVIFYNDSKASNPPAAVADLSGLDRPYIAIVGGKDKGSDFAALGELLARDAKAAILIGESAEAIALAMGEGAAPERAATLEEAIARGFELAAPGDAVIMAPACSSFDMFDSYVHRGEVFMRTARELEGSR